MNRTFNLSVMANTRKIAVIQSNKKTMKVAMITKSEDQ